MFQKCVLNFTWWVNRKDVDGRNLFGGGFLGLDNIGVFDRSRRCRTADTWSRPTAPPGWPSTAARMLSMALELAQEGPGLRGHGVEVLRALRRHRRRDEHARRHGPVGRGGRLLLRPAARRRPRGAAADPVAGRPHAAHRRRGARAGHARSPARRSRKRMQLVPRQPARPGSARSRTCTPRAAAGALLAIPARERLERLLRYMLDENEFLSPYGIRSLSRVHLEPAVPLLARRPESRRRLHARRIDDRHLRRQLELARPGLVSAELPADRGARALSPLLRRRPAGRAARPARAGA